MRQVESNSTIIQSMTAKVKYSELSLAGLEVTKMGRGNTTEFALQ